MKVSRIRTVHDRTEPMPGSLLRSLLLAILAVAGATALRASAQGVTQDPASRRPNVLWLMSDEHRTDSLGSYGSPWASTPNLDRLAREGVRFVHAITPAPVCVPARTSILTGRYPSAVGVWHNAFPDRHSIPELLTERFHQAGYRSASFGKQHYAGTKKAFQTEMNLTLSDE